MARRPNYDFQKRQKELQRAEKQAEKAERKRLRKESGEEDDGIAWDEAHGAIPADDDGDEESGDEDKA